MSKPIAQYWQPCYDEKLAKKSEYFERSHYWLYWDEATPARTDSGTVAEIDMPDEEVLEKHLTKLFNEKTQSHWFNSYYKSIGVGLSKDNYDMPEWLRKIIIENGYQVWDE